MIILFMLLIWCAGPARAENLYNLGKVEYFPSKVKPKLQVQHEMDWQEPAPPLVLKLLNEPNEGNARAYLQWQRQKLERLINAQNAVRQVLLQQKEGK